MKSFFINMIKSIITTVIISLILIFTRKIFLDHVLQHIYAIRGTKHLEGEDKGQEFFTVLVLIIFPSILILSFIIFEIRTKKLTR